MNDIEELPTVIKKDRSDDWKAVYMSVGIAFIFFGTLVELLSQEGSNTTQNFVVPIYSGCFLECGLRIESVGALSLGIMYIVATVASFFAPSIISRFSSERSALAFFSFEFW